MLKPVKIIIHHSLTADSGSASWDAIRRFHVNVRGWLDIGYHAGCEYVGDTVECFYGRPDVLMGAHAQGQNGRSLGFCFVGNYDEEEPSDEMLKTAAKRVLAPWCVRHGILPSGIRPHNEFSNKTCPGTMFPMYRLREMVWEETRRLK